MHSNHKSLVYALFQKLIYILLLQSYAVMSYADSKFPTPIVVVDVQSIIEHSIAIQDIRKKIDIINNKTQKHIATKEAELKKIEAELIKKRDILTKDLFEKEVTAFNLIVSETQKEIHNKKTAVERAHAEAISKVHDVSMKIIGDLAKKYNFNIVLPSSQVLFAADELNLTQTVIQLLNEKLTTVPIQIND